MNAHEMHAKQLVAEGVLLLLQDFSPGLVEDFLLSYLTTSEAEKYRKEHGGGAA
jgi:flagellar motor component MotA